MPAIKDLSFEINKGERVAFIGPNGEEQINHDQDNADGILHPTSGDVEVLGLVPWKDRVCTWISNWHGIWPKRPQLWYHLPPTDTFDLLSKIYEIDPKSYRIRLHELVHLFEIEHILDKPVRQLSLGERMRCEIVASLMRSYIDS